MSKSGKILLLALTVLPVLLIGLYMYSFFQMFAGMVPPVPGQPMEPKLPEGFFTTLIWIGAVGLVSLGLMVYYVVHIVRNPKFRLPDQSNGKLIWLLIVIFGGFIGMLVYFFLEIWPEKEASA